MAELDPFAAELERRSKVGGEVRAPSSTPDPFAAELARRNASEGGATPAPGAAVPGAGPAPPQTLLGGFYGGVKRGIKEDAAMFKGAIGTGLSAVGIDAGESLLDDAISDMHRAESATPRAVPSYKDVEGVHDALMYGAETLGEQLPTIATVIAGGGLGGAAIKVGVRKAAERGLKKATQDRLEKHAFTAGAVGTATGLETGGTAAEIKESTGESNPALAIAGGVAKGALEAVTPIALAKNLGLMPSVAKGLSGTIAKALEGATVSRIAKGAVATAAGEAGTEMVQESIDVAIRGYVDKNYDTLGPETAERIINAGLAGAIAGGTVGGIASAVAGEVAPDAPVTVEQMREAAKAPKPAPSTMKETHRPEGEEDIATYGTAAAPVSEGMRQVEPIQELTEAQEKQLQKEVELRDKSGIPLKTGFASVGATEETAPPPVNENAASMGSEAGDAALGFELLPSAYSNIPAREVGDLLRAPLDLAIRKLRVEENQLDTEAKLSSAARGLRERGGVAPLVTAQTARLDATRTAINSLTLAGVTAHSGQVPVVIPGFTEGDTLVTQQTHVARTAELVPNGYALQLLANDFINVKSPTGRTILQLPNRDWAAPLIRTVATADQELETSGFYSAAAGNIQKLAAMGKDPIDLRSIGTLPTSIAKSVQVVKRLGVQKVVRASNHNITPTKVPPLAPNLNSIEADMIKFNQSMSWWNTLLQIIQRNPNYRPLVEYGDVVQTEDAQKKAIIAVAQDILHGLQRVGSQQQNAAAAYLWDLEQMEYLTPEEKAHNAKEGEDKIVRWPTELEISGLVDRHQLRRETFELIIRIQRSSEVERFNQHIAVIEQELLKLPDAKSRNNQIRRLNIYKKRYFSRPRFRFAQVGNLVVEVRDPDGKLVAARTHETGTEQALTFREYQRKYGSQVGYTIKKSKLPETIRQWLGTPDVLLIQLMRSGFLSGLGKGQKQLAVFLARSNPSMKRRFVQSADPRRGMGADLMRAFAQSAMTDANNLFKMRAAPKLQRILGQMEVDRKSGKSTVNLGKLIDFLNGHMQDVLNPVEDAAKIRAFAFLWWLSFVPASAVLNASQVPITTWPYLSSRFGTPRTVKEIMKAYTERNTYWGKGKLSDSELDYRFMERAMKDGFAEESQATEVAGIGEGSNLQRMLGTTKLDRTLKQWSYYGAYMFQQVEKVNRFVTFKAATRLAMAKPDTKYLTDLELQNTQTFEGLKLEGFSPEEARAYLAGRDAVRQTQFEYNRWNRPKFMKGKVGGTLFTFWMFTQGMLNFGRRSPGALKFWFVMIAIGGIMGLPGADDLKEIIKAASQWWFGKDFDVEREAREFITLIINPYLDENLPEWAPRQVSADLFLHGASENSFGLANLGEMIGMPHVPRIDMSGSLSMGRLLPIDPSVFKPGVEWNERVAKTAERLAGAALGPAFAMANALQDQQLPGDDFKMWERAMPRALRSLMRAGRLGAEGRERTRTGADVTDFDPMDPQHNAELIAISMGFQSTRLSRKWDRTIATQELDKYWDLRKAIILKQLDHATYMRDKDGRADVMKAVRKYNTEAKEAGFSLKGISSDTIRRSMKERQRRRAQQSAGRPSTKSAVQIHQLMQQLYPEVPE